MMEDKWTNKISTTDPRTFVILDDCFYDDKWTRDEFMRHSCMNGKHWKVLLIMTLPYPPVLIANVDYFTRTWYG